MPGTPKKRRPAIIVLRVVLLTILGLIAFVLLYLAAAFGLSRITVEKEPETRQEVTIYIKTNGVHTDVVVPVRNSLYDWSTQLKFAHTKAADSTARYVGLGWGDKGFYLETPTWADLTVSVAFNAMFGLGSSAIHSTYYNTLKEDETCIRIDISEEQYKRLVRFIIDTFQKDPDGNFIHIPTTANYGHFDAFYEAVGRYNMFYTCNCWTNSALKSCGQRACLWTPFDKGIFYQYKKQ